MLNNDFKVLRYQNKPDLIKVLFIGESRPNGRTIFYNENSNLYKYTEVDFCQELR